ncbi:MAG: DegT/DnrJ/EryC1/StrS family aminotransferase [Desulfovibrionaceae bacterium]
MSNTLALLGGAPVRTEPFPAYPVIDDADKAAVMAVLDRGALSTFGAGPKGNFAGGVEIRAFEQEFAAFNQSAYALAVNSATAGLHCALAAAGVGPGDEVIVPPYTFTATATAVLHHNAVPIFCDVEDTTFCLDPAKVEACVTPRTKAIIPVHLLGHPADMDAIMAIAARHNLVVIEDCAQAPGASYKGVRVGNIGHMGVFSFQETKNLPVGEGGMITTNDEQLAERCKMIRNHGESIILGQPRSYVSNIIGWNYRMTEMEAALGRSRLRKLAKENAVRKTLFEHLEKGLAGLPGLTTPRIGADAVHAYHIYGMRYDAAATGVDRAVILKALQAEGVPVTPSYWRPLYANPIFQEARAYGEQGCPFKCPFYKGSVDYTKVVCEVAERLIYQQALWLFIVRPPATTADMDDIIGGFRKVWANMAALRDATV